MKRRILLGLVLVSVVAQPVSAAKRLDNAPEPERLTQEQVDAVPYRDLNFTPTAATAGDYHKYFVFHRDDTSFERAFADINECDSLVSGSNIYMGGNDAVTNSVAMQYGMAGAIAGPLVGLAMDAILNTIPLKTIYLMWYSSLSSIAHISLLLQIHQATLRQTEPAR